MSLTVLRANFNYKPPPNVAGDTFGMEWLLAYWKYGHRNEEQVMRDPQNLIKSERSQFYDFGLDWMLDLPEIVCIREPIEDRRIT